MAGETDSALWTDSGMRGKSAVKHVIINGNTSDRERWTVERRYPLNYI
jgi:hypothetical protein